MQLKAILVVVYLCQIFNSLEAGAISWRVYDLISS